MKLEIHLTEFNNLNKKLDCVNDKLDNFFKTIYRLEERIKVIEK